MGVTGLWRLIEPSGKPVPLETLENKVLAVDISIWLHQAVKGFQDSKGAPLPNAHLLGIYHRVCKLLYFRIKPIFVFDGGVPNLKKQTIAKRNQLKSKTLNEADNIQKQLINTLLKHSAINKIIAEKAKEKLEASSKPSTSKISTRTEKDDMFKLPEIDNDFSISSNDEESDSTDSSPTKHWDIHTIDEKSPHFQSLPPDVRHEILTELKETRKQSSWDRIHEIPKDSGDFSSYQMKRLLKRFSIQASLEEAEKEMGGHSLSLAELELLLQDQGVVSKEIGQRIASNENTRFLLIKDIKKTMEKAKIQEVKNKKLIEQENVEQTSNLNSENYLTTDMSKDEDTELQLAIQLSLQCEAQVEKPTENEDKDAHKGMHLSLLSTSNTSQEKINDSQKLKSSFLNDSLLQEFGDSEEESKPPYKKNLSSAKNYMMEYSGLTPNEIEKIIGSHTTKTKQKAIADSTSYKNKNGNLEFQKKVPTTITITNSIESNKDINSDIFSKKTDINIKEVDRAVEVELMSDSDSSDDLLEVSTTELTIPTKTTGLSFEITIQQNELLQDDLFNDIFSKSTVSEPTSYTQYKIIRNRLPPIPEETDNIENKTISKEIKNSQNETISKSIDPIIFLKETDNVPETELTKENVTNTKSDANKSTGLTQQENKDKVIKELLQNLEKSNTVHTNVDDIPKEAVNVLNTNQLKQIQENLVKEQTQLISEKSSKERLATNITDQMYQEAQELLQLFGVPYIVAPMEAEAQCAFLELIDLTDGTITDDSDIWLFGGRTVYKNFFNQNKYVLEFKSEDIEHHFKLTREQMILLALLVGSDYTVGLQGIGPVTALEILAAFPPPKVTEFSLSHQQLLSGLSEFRSWLTGRKSLPGKTSLRNKLKNVVFTENFPSFQVVQAYLDPKVDTSKEPFSWAAPDIVALTDFAKDKFGWTRLKSEEILKPVIKRMKEKHIQKSIREYFKTKYKLYTTETEAKMSKRVQKAVQKIGTESSDPLDEEQTNKIRGRKKKNDTETKNEKSENTKKSKFNKSIEINKDISEQDSDFVEKPVQAKKGTSNKNSDNLSVPKGKPLKLQENKKDTGNIKRSQKTKRKEDKDDTNYKLSENSESTDQGNARKRTSKKEVSKSTWSLSAPATEEINKVQQAYNDSKDSGIDDTDRISVELPVTDSNETGFVKINEPSTSGAIAPKRPKNSSKNTKKQKTDVDKIAIGDDEEMKILQDTITRSKSKIELIRSQLTDQLKRNTRSIKEPREIIRDVSGPISPLDQLKTENIHKKEVIPQKIQDNLTMMRSKMKAIEILKTRRNATKKRQKAKRTTHIGTHYLSESSSDEDIKKT